MALMIEINDYKDCLKGRYQSLPSVNDTLKLMDLALKDQSFATNIVTQTH